MKFDATLDFKKVHLNFEPPVRKGKYVRILKNRMTISSALVREAGWAEGDRVDLLQSGSVFALERSPVGVFKMNKPNYATYVLTINSVVMCRHIRTVTSEDCVMKGMVDGKRIIFWKDEE